MKLLMKLALSIANGSYAAYLLVFSIPFLVNPLAWLTIIPIAITLCVLPVVVVNVLVIFRLWRRDGKFFGAFYIAAASDWLTGFVIMISRLPGAWVAPNWNDPNYRSSMLWVLIAAVLIFKGMLEIELARKMEPGLPN